MHDLVEHYNIVFAVIVVLYFYFEVNKIALFFFKFNIIRP